MAIDYAKIFVVLNIVYNILDEYSQLHNYRIGKLAIWTSEKCCIT